MSCILQYNNRNYKETLVHMLMLFELVHLYPARKYGFMNISRSKDLNTWTENRFLQAVYTDISLSVVCIKDTLLSALVAVVGGIRRTHWRWWGLEATAEVTLSLQACLADKLTDAGDTGAGQLGVEAVESSASLLTATTVRTSSQDAVEILVAVGVIHIAGVQSFIEFETTIPTTLVCILLRYKGVSP